MHSIREEHPLDSATALPANERNPVKNRASLAVAMLYPGNTPGVLEVANKNEFAHYTEEELIIPEKIASQVAPVIQNARLLEKVQHSFDQAAQLDRMKSDCTCIPPGDLMHRFKRFHQLESHSTRRHGSMGLGLSASNLVFIC